MSLTWQDGDRLFERLVEAMEPFDAARREAFLARLVLLLAAEVAEGPKLLAAVEEAEQSMLTCHQSYG